MSAAPAGPGAPVTGGGPAPEPWTVADALDVLQLRGPLPVDDRSEPLGTAWLQRHQLGIDLAAAGYVEEEYLVAGIAADWRWDDHLRAVAGPRHRYVTRMMVRRPADPDRCSGSVQLEPHHPDDDRALSWGMVAPWVLRSGHVHIGFTQEPASAADLVQWDPERYGTLQLLPGQRWEIAGQLAAAVTQGRVPGLPVSAATRVVASGWSMTGTFWRTFLGEGFDRWCRITDDPAIAAYVICISSGGAGRAGYASLGDGVVLPLDDPRRRIAGHGVPVVELLSEGESETHHEVLRADSNQAVDRYRLYQVAGTGHVVSTVPALHTNGVQRRERGAPVLLREIVEEPSDARMDLVARCIFDAVDRWAAGGVAPPSAERFAFDDPDGPGVRGVMAESWPLHRGPDGNVIGGLRTPWADVPLATYLPHSQPRPGRCQPAPHAPYRDPALLADLVAHRVPFPPEEIARRYGSLSEALSRFEQRVGELVDAGWLLAADAPELTAWMASRHGA